MNKPQQLSNIDRIKLLAACETSCNRHLGDLIQFVMFSGCEKFAAMRLCWSDVDFAHSQITLAGRTHNYTIPMTGALRRILQRRKDRSVVLDLIFWTDHKSRNGAHPRAYCDHFVPGGDLKKCTDTPWAITDLRETYKQIARATVHPLLAAHLTGSIHHQSIVSIDIDQSELLRAAEMVYEALILGGRR